MSLFDKINDSLVVHTMEIHSRTQQFSTRYSPLSLALTESSDHLILFTTSLRNLFCCFGPTIYNVQK